MGGDFCKPAVGQELLRSVNEQIRLELADQLQQGLPVAVAFAAGINACVIRDTGTWWWLVGLGPDTAAKGECPTREAAAEAAGSAAAGLAWLNLQEEQMAA